MKELQWENGIGFLPVGDSPVSYDSTYFQRYVDLARTAQGRYITDLRVAWVERHVRQKINAQVLDVGIGCGAFIQAMRRAGWECRGTDVNPVALEWLKKKGLDWNAGDQVDILTFWDVLEHIPNPGALFHTHQAQFVFMSLPVFDDVGHVLRSKHFKPGEHCWYFTPEGLVRFMEGVGYRLIGSSQMETEKGGREGIGTFAFERF